MQIFIVIVCVKFLSRLSNSGCEFLWQLFAGISEEIVKLRMWGSCCNHLPQVFEEIVKLRMGVCEISEQIVKLRM